MPLPSPAPAPGPAPGPAPAPAPPSIQEYVYVYFGRSSFNAADINANYDMRFDLTGSAPTWQDPTSIPTFTFGDVNNDGRKDFILSRSGDDPYYTISGSTFTINSTNTGTQRLNAGMSYVIYQPSAGWGATPGLTKDFFADYSFDGTDGIRIAGGVATDGMSIRDSGDMNKDRKNDLILSSGVSPTGGYFLFGKTNWPVTYDTNCMRDTSGGHCTTQILAK